MNKPTMERMKSLGARAQELGFNLKCEGLFPMFWQLLASNGGAASQVVAHRGDGANPREALDSLQAQIDALAPEVT